MCARDCPAFAIEIVEVDGKKRPQFDLNKCIFCNQCVESCPRNAIKGTAEYELATTDKNSLIITPNPNLRKVQNNDYWILEILSIGLIISACFALFLDEVVYSVAALAGTFLFTALLYLENGATYAAIFQFAVGVGTLAILFFSGEMLSDKSTKKTSPTKAGALLGVGVILSLPAIFLSVSGSTGSIFNVLFRRFLVEPEWHGRDFAGFSYFNGGVRNRHHFV